MEALGSARRSVVLFLEHVPDTLETWLRCHVASGTAATAFRAAVGQVVAATAWTGAHGLQHLDAHPRNVLVRDGRLLFTDVGLALHQDWDLDRDERAFFAAHAGYDHDTGITSLLHRVLVETGVGSGERAREILQAAAADPRAPELTPVRAVLGSGADLIAEHAAVALATTALFDVLLEDATAASYGSVAEARRGVAAKSNG